MTKTNKKRINQSVKKRVCFRTLFEVNKPVMNFGNYNSKMHKKKLPSIKC